MLKKRLLLVILVGFVFFGVFFISLGSVSAASCWTYNTASGCSGNSSCSWKNDSWGGWCEEVNCWSLWNQTACQNTVIPGKNCSWQGSSTNYWCEQLSCWTFSGTNETACVNNTAGKSCSWSNYCFGTGTASAGVDCYNYNDASSCTNATGCSWGSCYEKGCWSNTDSASCAAGKDWRGFNCTWDSSSSYCKEKNCWDIKNQTGCNVAAGISCTWKWDSCQEVRCWNWDGTDATTCQNNTQNISCSWTGQWCEEKGCWSNSNQATCEATASCTWSAVSTSGWCEQVQCWNWDSWKGGNQSDCDDNSYGLSCNWQGNPTGNLTSGWCFQDISSVNCTNITTERGCMDTYWCWWQYSNWNDVTQGGNCNDPNWGAAGYDADSILNDWNPGCYIFDLNQTSCGLTLGCDNQTAGTCSTNLTHPNNITINSVGLNCTMINNSQTCNNIPALSTCCSWQNGTCAENRVSTSCYDQVKQKDEDNCEDADTQARCDEISNSPWFMPCKWDNTTENCLFDSVNVFGNGSKSVLKLENKRNCEAAGGLWLTENYCEGNVSIPSGRCEYKCNQEDDCDKECFACESYTSKGNTVNSSNAESACLNSKLGYCQFKASTSSPNGIGFCNPKKQFVLGIATNCNTDCGSCTYMGDPNSNDSTKRPSYYCANSKANEAGGKCKWASDNSTETGGTCVNKGEKTCVDACDRCTTRTGCANKGRTALSNQSGACKWNGGDSDGTCVDNLGDNTEVCWNGADDNANGLIDCADPGCYTDSFCGFVTGDCFVYNTSAKCNIKNASCEWITDKWGSWCDFKGANCWNKDNNQSICEGLTIVTNETLEINTSRQNAGNDVNGSIQFSLGNNGQGWVQGSIKIVNGSGQLYNGTNYTVNYGNFTINFSNNTYMVTGGGMTNTTKISYEYYITNCKWTNGSGNAWCERDWGVMETCMGLNLAACNAANASGCNWTVDTWCAGQGNSSDWCKDAGGWCDHNSFKPKECWLYHGSAACDEVSGCAWRTNEWNNPYCEMNWSNNCWLQTDSSNCEAETGCYWRNDTWGSWCVNEFDKCWNSNTQADCESKTGFGGSRLCYWDDVSWGGQWASCNAICFNSTNVINNNSCAAASGCDWIDESGWCEERHVESCSNSTNYNNQTACQASTDCRWRESGWCDPRDGGFSSGGLAGGGGIGGAMSECYKYDGNKTLCTNSTIINISCGWFEEQSPFCDVDWSTNCWENLNSSDCFSNGCWWNNDKSYCTNVKDQCWFNVSLQSDSSACNSTGNCTSTVWGGCEANCLNATTEAACGGGCNWVDGWCNPGGMHDMFDDMEKGALVPLGFDVCNVSDTSQASVDICGYGMKDMVNGYGFGVNVFDFSNASICNKQKLSSLVTGMAGGAFAGETLGTEKFGDGNETIKFFLYLDTDGSATGGCTLTDNSSAVGYEFKFKYTSEWNASTDKAVETFNAYKCSGGNWEATDIKLSTWKKMMCNDVGGMMLAVQKSDLVRFPKLYNSSSDMRLYFATANESSNHSSPSDTAGPVYTTPGAIDFAISDMFAYGADAAKFGDVLRQCYIGYEDCFNGVDDDNDGNIDCNDYDCQYATRCANTGVNQVGFSDTTAPQVKGVKTEEYLDSVKIMYDTTKPTNGTLFFYGNDSKCLTLNSTVYDVGVLKNNSVREFKLWHKAELFNDANSLTFNLTNGTTYYYKLKVCDSSAKCAQSKCSSFVTAALENKCGYCNFVTKIDVPSGWNISYDLEQDGTYEHSQGQVCGPSAGMKTNYSSGRLADIKLSKNDGSVYFEFINATLSKSGLNNNVRSIDASGDIILSAGNYVGLTSQTRDKIINNLHPEICRVKIPFSGTCDTLLHCDDSGNNCIDRTVAAGGVPIDATNCVWNAPFCEFSTYREAEASGSGGNNGGGGGGSAGATTTNETETVKKPEPKKDKPTEDGGEGIENVPRGEAASNKFLLIGGIVMGIVIVIIISVSFYYKRRKKLFGF